jgi:putative ABC transport system substrate-binding protein
LPLALSARPAAAAKLPRIGVLWHAGSEDQEREYFTVLMKAFADLGYADGKTAEFLHRYPAERLERFEQLAKELVDARVDVIVSVTIRGTNALKPIARTIPVVFVLAADPVGDKLVDSLAHPGGNMTGLSLMSADLSGKRVALLKEALPAAKRVAVLTDPKDPNSFVTPGARTSAEALGLSLVEIDVAGPDEIEQAFASIAADGFDGAMVAGSMFFNERAGVGAAALKNRVPTISLIAEAVPYGLLMSYGPDFPEFFRRSAGYADRILKGARPADLPVEQPTRFRQVLNLKVARALGVKIPESLLVTTNETIE